MLIVCWAAKGGSGTTVTTAALAIALARTHGGTLLVDLDGDAPAALGIAEPVGPGVTDWVAASTPEEGALDALVSPAGPDVRLLHRGAAHPPGDDPRWERLGRHLSRLDTPTVVDAGTGLPPSGLMAAADRSWLITRPCYLAVRAAVAQAPLLTPSGVVVVAEPGRALRATDIASAVQVPIVAELALDPAVARAVDAGLLATRLPRGLLSQLATAA